MNKSNIAYQVVEDIYTFNKKYLNAKIKFKENKINKNQFSNAQYVILCKLAYLSEVVELLKEKGYKFAKYEKELCVLTDLVDRITDTFNLNDLTDLSTQESFSIAEYLTKYEEVVNVIDEFYDDLKESVKN